MSLDIVQVKGLEPRDPDFQTLSATGVVCLIGLGTSILQS